MNNSLIDDKNIRSDAELDQAKKRALFRSTHRGCKEMDLVMGQFAEKYLLGMNEEQLSLYDVLLDEDDLLIWDWVVGRSEPNPKYTELITTMKEYAPVI